MYRFSGIVLSLGPKGAAISQDASRQVYVADKASKGIRGLDKIEIVFIRLRCGGVLFIMVTDVRLLKVARNSALIGVQCNERARPQLVLIIRASRDLF